MSDVSTALAEANRASVALKAANIDVIFSSVHTSAYLGRIITYPMSGNGMGGRSRPACSTRGVELAKTSQTRAQYNVLGPNRIVYIGVI